jgi:hypothetical protein
MAGAGVGALELLGMPMCRIAVVKISVVLIHAGVGVGKLEFLGLPLQCVTVVQVTLVHGMHLGAF